jgi:hypothetical protein
MTKEELAIRLNGREYMNEITKEEENIAKASGLVVCFGASDDNLEFRGAIDDETGAWHGTEAYITSGGLLKNECKDEDCLYFEKIREATKAIVSAIWDKDGYSWVIDSNLPYTPFDIMEDGMKYCRGIIINLKEA